MEERKQAEEAVRLEDRTRHNTPPFSLDGKLHRTRVIDVYDGDTIKAIVELFPGLCYVFRFRLRHIDAPEIRGRGGCDRERALASRNRLIEMVSSIRHPPPPTTPTTFASRKDVQRWFDAHCCIVYVRCFGVCKYGRPLADVFADDDATTVSFNSMLLAEGLACAYGDV
jgi:endonuclease YncB( thermonuclease family)